MSIKLELMREHIDPKKSASVGLLGDVVDMLVEELRLLADRIDGLEKRIDATAGAMRYAGEWVPGFEYSPGDLVEFEAAVFVCVQPRELDQPPSRFTGWAKLPMEA